ncbi:unnamed protein product [Somion occarium]|uniref:Uncharacterized protein n=1 Tax=Somion occarium TaxID=3059160 RepID=A0ABP1EAF6_9APHY
MNRHFAILDTQRSVLRHVTSTPRILSPPSYLLQLPITHRVIERSSCATSSRFRHWLLYPVSSLFFCYFCLRFPRARKGVLLKPARNTERQTAAVLSILSF